MRARDYLSFAVAVGLAMALGAACGGSSSDTTPPAYQHAGAYTTQYRWGGASGTWYAHAPVDVTAAGEVFKGGTQIKNAVVGDSKISWTMIGGNDSNAELNFLDGSSNAYYWGPGGHTGKVFEGFVQHPGEGPCDYRGVRQ